MNKRVIALLLLPALLLIVSCSTQKKMARKKRTYMASVYNEVKKVLNEADVTILNDTVKVLFPEHLLFRKNSAEINGETRPLMKRFAGALELYPETRILINGYTDKTGDDEHNRKLSENRAVAAKTMLVSFAVQESRMLTWGMGNTNAIATNDTEEGRRKNRRVEFIILYNYEDKP